VSLSWNPKNILHKYLNAYIFCVIFIAALLILPTYSTDTPKGVVLIKNGLVTESAVRIPSLVENNQWRPAILPHPPKYTASGTVVYEWFSVSLPEVVNDKEPEAILIRSFPLGGKIFLGDREIYKISRGSKSEIARNNLPIFLPLSTEDLARSHNLYIKIESVLSIGDLEPIYFGSSNEVQKLYKSFLTWNVEYQEVSSLMALCFIVIFGLAWFKHKDIVTLKNIFLLSLFWLGWAELMAIKKIPSNGLMLWRCSSGILISGLLYFYIVSGYSLAKIRAHAYLKYYFFYYAIASALIVVCDYGDSFFSAQLIVSLYVVLVGSILPIVYKGVVKKNFEVFSLSLIFLASNPVSAHDFLVWLGLLQKWNLYLCNLGIPEFFLQSTQLSYLTTIPYFLTAGIASTKIIDERKYFKQESIKAAHNERSKIIRDLHDGLGAILTMGAIQAQSGNLSAEKAQETITKALVELRLVINGFNGDTQNLRTIIETIAMQTQKMFSGGSEVMKVTYRLPGVDKSDPGISNQVAISLVKFMREAVINAAKHSEGTSIHIELSYNHTDLRIEVIDNGPVGFDFEKMIAHPVGRGLRNMIAHSQVSGGTLEYVSIPGRTRIAITVPI